MSQQENKYLRKMGLFKTEITKVSQSEWKGKKSLVVTFRGEHERLIDAKFYLPLNEISKKQLANLCKACDVAAPKDLPNKSCVILVSPSEIITPKGEKKLYWNVTKFFHPFVEKYMDKFADEVALEEIGDVFGVDHEAEKETEDFLSGIK